VAITQNLLSRREDRLSCKIQVISCYCPHSWLRQEGLDTLS